jgi:hypothetical protein
MGLRGILRDILSIYVCIIVFGNLISGNMKADLTFGLATLALFILSIWFLLERIGIVPKFY